MNIKGETKANTLRYYYTLLFKLECVLVFTSHNAHSKQKNNNVIVESVNVNQGMSYTPFVRTE